MIDHNSTDDEQIAALKAAWKEHGRAIFTGVILGVCVLVGWNYWQSYKLARAQEGAELFNQVERALELNDTPTMENGVALLEEKYGGTPYLALGKLALAKLKAETGDYPAAQQALSWVVSNANDVETRDLAKLRLAAVHNATGNYQAALDLLSSGISDAFSSLADEHRGDAYGGLGQLEEARAAYDQALQNAPGAEFLQWKRDSLGDAVVTGDAS